LLASFQTFNTTSPFPDVSFHRLLPPQIFLSNQKPETLKQKQLTDEEQLTYLENVGQGVEITLSNGAKPLAESTTGRRTRRN
jgi:hypothetical protein